jgi:molybdopterin converting factor small subunit
MKIRVRLHGLLVSAASEPEGLLVLDLAVGTDVAGLIDHLREDLASSFFDGRALLATVEGVLVPLDRTLGDGDTVGLYHTFSGG